MSVIRLFPVTIPCPHCGDPQGRHRITEEDFAKESDTAALYREMYAERLECKLFHVATLMIKFREDLQQLDDDVRRAIGIQK